MEITSLPDHLNLESAEIEVYDYHVSHSCLKNKINLTQHTFSFLQEGSKEVNTNSTPISIQNSSFLLMKSGHCLMTEKLAAPTKTYRSILLFFSNAALLDFGNKHKLDSKSNTAVNPIKSFNYDDFTHTFVNGLKNIISFSGSIRKKLLKVKIEEIMLYLIELNGPEFYYSLLSEADLKKSKLTQVIENNKFDKLTVSELAFLCNMSVSSFKREFEQEYETSPIKWFQNQRLIHSAYLLSNQKTRPSDIFEKAGYESLSNFIQAFKKKYGVTPKQFQQKN